jgi:mannose-1-phosphate guanylyltransferase
VKAAILCAGLGTRLRPLTNLWPKPALPLLGQPLIRYALATLLPAGVTEVVINTHHLPEVMEATARAECERAGLKLQVVHEGGEIQGTGGGLRGMKKFLEDDTFVVLNGDVLFAVEVAALVEAHRRSKAPASMVLLPMPSGEAYNSVEVDAEGLVRRIAGKGPGGTALSPWHFTGLHVMTPEVFRFMAPDGPLDINHDVYLRMIADGEEVRAHPITGRGVFWSDLGTARRYAATHQDLLFKQVGLEAFGDASPYRDGEFGPSNYWAHRTAELADVKVSGPAWFGEGCVLGRGVHIGAAVSVGPRAKIGEGAMLNRVAVLDGAEVAPGVLLEDTIVGPGGMVLPTLEPKELR